MEIAQLYNLYTQHYLVNTDTRNIRKNTIFFALKGDNFNGNSFAEEALKLGANYAIVDEEVYQTQDAIILVPNVLETLQQLANYHRKQLKATIIGLTGSNGKTTTKELIFAVLSKKYKTIATKGNLNNHIGVPLTLLSMPIDTEMGIVEMGANHQKEIEFLSSICEPDFGYITNFGKAHLEGFGGVEGVIKGKSELYHFLEQNNKIAFINPDDKIQVDKTKNITTIPFLPSIALKEANPFVQLSYDNLVINSNLIGTYNYTNIAIAITIGNYFKVKDDVIKEAIEGYESTNNRSQIINQNSNVIILDAYNANPSSMKVALENFHALKADHKIVILGDMFELGDARLEEHQQIVNMATQMNFNGYYFVGEHFYQTKENENLFKTFDDFKNDFENNIPSNSSILIKGSRGMRLERVVELLK
ncbi:UDP-N-acetylmuramoyl-tripeptide--D-alanyl-D-alanine ligase [Polaribacter sp. MED152]|uniref:UDP-N-acetylmuramoyl-tripeptide--D-alanyl-D- alanine ligase n=1 Tax=Polaribacter sp. MED152 TaxID=313598 RepID=UPI000068CD39|nr:UDP-N-acetylmuramoyl-tripeptide--D-alanyl-D-alanine ligase [Polaribacter sp. MED152]EAQ42162.1 UDP-N-acetylmuramyl pentapeptide synthase [Polaribacter sp. MED152]